MMGAESYWNVGISGQGVKVAVVDTGINSRHPFLKDMVKSWVNVFRYGANKGVLFAVASGNDLGFMPLFPAVFAGTIPGFGFSVGALDQLRNLAVFSNWTGNNLNMKHVSSHGARVLSVDYETDGFVSMSGTSMAAPQIAGFLALVRQANPNATNDEIIQLVSKNVKRADINN